MKEYKKSRLDEYVKEHNKQKKEKLLEAAVIELYGHNGRSYLCKIMGMAIDEANKEYIALGSDEGHLVAGKILDAFALRQLKVVHISWADVFGNK